jgi:Ni/Co efflux regulator RcnB
LILYTKHFADLAISQIRERERERQRQKQRETERDTERERDKEKRREEKRREEREERRMECQYTVFEDGLLLRYYLTNDIFTLNIHFYDSQRTELYFHMDYKGNRNLVHL